MLSQRGQEEAPFELLIAVIIMAFVIFLGLQAMNYVQAEQCKAQIKKSAADMKAVIQEVVAGNMKSLVFYPPQCFLKEKDVEEMRFVVIKDSIQCSRLCSSAKNECFVFSYYAKDFDYKLCFETVSPQTTFYSADPCNDYPEKLSPVNMKEGIPRGAYEFVNKSGYGESFPKICAYLRGA